MAKPDDVFDRVQEWDNLQEFARGPGPGVRLALVRGRRRQGKSYLLRRLAEANGGLYYQALEEERSQALESFGRAVGNHLAVPGDGLRFTDWEAAFEAAMGIDRSDPTVLVIDEFPYLLARSPELPSVLQRLIDRSRDGGPAVRLILCGSALSVMATLLEGAQALRGRASLDLVVLGFDFRTAAAFWAIDDPVAAFQVDATIGGTPGYRDLLPHAAPRRAVDTARWLERGVLNPASAMFREDDYLLTEERSITDRALYHAVLGAIAAGATSQSAVAASVGRESRAVEHPLRALEEAGFVQREADALRDRRPILRLADPIVRFHHAVTRFDLARFEDRRFSAAWVDARPRWLSQVLGPHFEHLAREFARRHASEGTLGGAPTTIGPAVVNDRKGRAQHQIDLVVRSRSGDGGLTTSAIGEAKHTTAPRSLVDVTRLEAIRALLTTRGQASPATKLLLFSASGFDKAVEAAGSSRADLELIDLVRLYRGD